MDSYPFTTKLELVQYKIMRFSYTTKLSHLDQLKTSRDILSVESARTGARCQLKNTGKMETLSLLPWHNYVYVDGRIHVPGGTPSLTLSPAPRVRTARSYDSTNLAILLIISTSSLRLWAVPTHNKCCHYFLMGPLCSWVLLASY